MKYIVRKPDFVVEIMKPDYSAASYVTVPPVFRFVPSRVSNYSKNEIVSNDLVSYQFSETLATVNSGFALQLVPRLFSDGEGWLEKIKIYDLVFIYEFGELRYGGYVKSLRYTARISGDGKPNRRISISGGSFGELLSTFQLVLDLILYKGSPVAEAASVQLSAVLAAELEKGNNIGDLFKIIYDHFMDLAMAVGLEGVSIGLKPLLDHFLDFDSYISRDLNAIYPMALSLYNVGANNIWQILSNLLFPPVNELFGRWNYRSSKYEIVFRRTPFEPEDWKTLLWIEIPPVVIVDHDIGKSNEEIFTFYLGELAGAGISRNLAIISGESTGRNYVIDQEKWRKYGFRPMYIEFKYFNRDRDSADAAVLMRDVSKMLKRWFEHNDEFYSGTLTIMTLGNREYMKRNPRIGEKIKFLGGEFYLESSDHSWEFLGPMVTKLNITRGYKYDASGNMEAPMDQVSRKLEAITQETNLDYSVTVRR